MQEGRSFDSATLEQGLRELCPALHFDMGSKLGLPHPFIQDRQGVFYDGRHICSMDRGIVPEKKQWTVVTVWSPGLISEADEETASVRFHVIPPDEPGYADLYDEVRRGRHTNFVIRPDGALVRLEVWVQRKVPGRVVRVGWRHTFERLISARIPGITRKSLEMKFQVDLSTVPIWTGDPDAVAASTELLAEY